MKIKILILFFILFFPSLSYAEFIGIFCSIGEAKAAFPLNSYAYGDCPDPFECYGCISKRSRRDENGDWIYDWAFYFKGAATPGCGTCEDACYYTYTVDTVGPGSVSSSGGGSMCDHEVTMDVTPEEGATWEIVTCTDGECSKNGNELTVVSGAAQAEMLVVINFFRPAIDPDDPNHPCNKDTDGDGVMDYMDVSNDYPNNTSQYIEITRIDELSDGGSAPGKVQYAEYMVTYGNGKSALLKFGNRDLDLNKQYNEVYCNPYTSDCAKFTAGQIANDYPCDPNGEYEIEYPPQQEQETDPDNIQDDGEIPGDDSGINDNGLLEIIANNTGKTVENTAEIAKVNTNMDGKLKSINDKLDILKDINENIKDIDGGGGVAVTVEFPDESEDPPVDYGNPDAISEDDLPDYFTADDDNLKQVYDATDQEYKDKNQEFDTRISDIENSIKGSFSLNITSPTCSISFPVLGDTMEFNFCPYASHIAFMGRVFSFIVHLTLIIMIVRV